MKDVIASPEFLFMLDGLCAILKDKKCYSDSSVNQKVLYELIFRHRIWHQMPAFDFLREHSQKDKYRMMIMANEVVRVARTFNELHIKYALVKGISLNVLLYPTLLERSCKDIDLWVSSESYDEAISQLLLLGYKREKIGYSLDGFKERYHKKHHCDLIFYHSERKICVELHHKLSYPGFDWPKNKQLRFRTFSLFNMSVLTLDNDQHLLYLMLHGSIHAWMRLRWLYDIALFIKNRRCDLNKVMEIAKSADVAHVVEQTLILLKELLKFEDETLLYLTHTPSKRALLLVRLAKKFIIGDYMMQDNIKYFNSFIKYRYYRMKLASKKYRYSMIWNELFRLDGLFRRISLPEKLSFLYYILYPGWLFLHIIRKMRVSIKANNRAVQ